jgi:mannose-6-phosphate isomerase-like protein (cupin superfamily)
MYRSKLASPATLALFSGSLIAARRDFRRKIPANGRSRYRVACCRISSGRRRQAREHGPQYVGPTAPARGVAPTNPLEHRTRTVDYAIIMSGEIDMMLDDKTVHLKAGDVAVQQATNHAWLNHGKEPCRVIFVLMDSKEP